VSSGRGSEGPGTDGAVGLDLVAGFAVAVLSTLPAWWLLGRPSTLPMAVVLLYSALAVTLARTLPADAPGPGIGPANRVTLARTALALPVLALACQPLALPAPVAWWVIVVSTVAMVLDGVDGRVARRTGTETSFGARFDMEFDAALILALTVLVWSSGRAGAWVLAIGLMRYVFVVAGWAVPALRAELPASFRRKVVCVVQGVVLLVALGPIIPAPMALAACAGGLVALTWSFAVDVAWLLRAEPRQG
jgi:phosphatidylglycerophosphate synthase